MKISDTIIIIEERFSKVLNIKYTSSISHL